MKTTAEKIIDKIIGFDEWVEKNKEKFLQTHDCHSSSEDGCAGCELLGNTQ